MDRRNFLKSAAAMGGVALTPSLVASLFGSGAAKQTARVAFVKTTNRAAGVNRAVDLLGMKSFNAKDLFIKPNFNSADTPPGSTHIDTLVQTCCLKTHRFGGHFTLSLKNSVGLAAKRVPEDSYNYMSELHGSPHQRRMIAEINAAYQPVLIVLDGVDAFVTGGPDSGKQVNTQVILAGTDRISIDAVGGALLRYHGTTPEVSSGRIFEQEQIARAVELGLGIADPNQIELVTDDPDGAKYAKKIRAILN